jgi:hypothetical protein
MNMRLRRNRRPRTLTERQEVNEEMSGREARTERLEEPLRERQVLERSLLRLDPIRHLHHHPPKVLPHNVGDRADSLLGDQDLLREFAGRRELRGLVLCRDALMHVRMQEPPGGTPALAVRRHGGDPVEAHPIRSMNQTSTSLSEPKTDVQLKGHNRPEPIRVYRAPSVEQLIDHRRRAQNDDLRAERLDIDDVSVALVPRAVRLPVLLLGHVEQIADQRKPFRAGRKRKAVARFAARQPAESNRGADGADDIRRERVDGGHSRRKGRVPGEGGQKLGSLEVSGTVGIYIIWK